MHHIVPVLANVAVSRRQRARTVPMPKVILEVPFVHVPVAVFEATGAVHHVPLESTPVHIALHRRKCSLPMHFPPRELTDVYAKARASSFIFGRDIEIIVLGKHCYLHWSPSTKA